MKKFIIPIVAVALIGLYIYKNGVRELFTLGAVKKVRTESIEKLESRIDLSEAEFKKDIEAAERLADDYEKLGQKYIDRKSWTPAINSLEKAIGFGKAGSSTHYWLGLAYANRGTELNSKSDLKQAESHYLMALKINHKITDAQYGLAILYYYKLDKKDLALKSMKKIVYTKPIYYDAHFALGRFHFENGHFDDSLAVYENLYSILDKKRSNFRIDALKKKCKENLSIVMIELNRK